jgi:hypothetical protein
MHDSSISHVLGVDHGFNDSEFLYDISGRKWYLAKTGVLTILTTSLPVVLFHLLHHV